jgi:release factor glutamine methyltransferase
VTLLEAIQRSVDFLAKKGVDSPRLQAELLLSHVLGVPRMRLYLDFERELKPAEQDQYRKLVRRRGQREPLQHIVGSTSFCGLEMAVDRHVLVPRPETELLAELGWQFLNSLPPSPAPTALDFGTGSGCLAIALAVKSPAATLAALDVSPEALAVARQNAARHKVEARIEFFVGDGFKALTKKHLFDLIISNPPYIPSGEIDGLQPEVRDHDPRAALDGGADGLEFYRRLATEAAEFLKPGGKFMAEFGDGQEGAVSEIFREQKWIVEAVKADYNARPRILIAQRSAEPAA